MYNAVYNIMSCKIFIIVVLRQGTGNNRYLSTGYEGRWAQLYK